MEEVFDVSLDKLCAFSRQTETQITVDAPLHGSFLLLDGKVLKRKSAIKIRAPKENSTKQTPGLATPESIVQEASRFWIQDRMGVRDRKNRQEMAELLEQI